MPRWSAERRAAYVTGRNTPRKRVPGRVMVRLGRKPTAPFGALLPHVVRAKEMKAHPAPFKQQGRRSVGLSRLFDN